MDHILSHFESWEGKTMYFASRFCLINSVITSSFVHTFFVYKWPYSLLSTLNRAIRNFLWSSSIYVWKNVTVAWNVCSQSKVNGGCFNEALLSKFVWNLMTMFSEIFLFFEIDTNIRLVFLLLFGMMSMLFSLIFFLIVFALFVGIP